MKCRACYKVIKPIEQEDSEKLYYLCPKCNSRLCYHCQTPLDGNMKCKWCDR